MAASRGALPFVTPSLTSSKGSKVNMEAPAVSENIELVQLVRASPAENAPATSGEVNRSKGAHVSSDWADSAILVSIVIDPDPRNAAVGGSVQAPLRADRAGEEEG
jgi:hypothetical protein